MVNVNGSAVNSSISDALDILQAVQQPPFKVLQPRTAESTKALEASISIVPSKGLSMVSCCFLMAKAMHSHQTASVRAGTRVQP